MKSYLIKVFPTMKMRDKGRHECSNMNPFAVPASDRNKFQESFPNMQPVFDEAERAGSQERISKCWPCFSLAK